jgi:hypothetical protein
MATEDPTRRGAEAPASEDRRTERAVLALLLDEYPTRLTFAELALALDRCDGFATEDAIDRAARELIAAELVRREGAFLAPTRPALCFDRLGMA